MLYSFSKRTDREITVDKLQINYNQKLTACYTFKGLEKIKVDNLEAGETSSVILEFNVSNSAPYVHSLILNLSLESENNSCFMMIST